MKTKQARATGLNFFAMMAVCKKLPKRGAAQLEAQWRAAYYAAYKRDVVALALRG